jgi:hypothetical protein
VVEYAEHLPAGQPTRTLLALIVALAIGAAGATGIWALADDDRPATAGGPPAAAENPRTHWGHTQYRPTYPPQPIPEAGGQYGLEYRYPNP